MLGQDVELGHVTVLPAICLGAGLLDERDKPSVGEKKSVFQWQTKQEGLWQNCLGE